MRPDLRLWRRGLLSAGLVGALLLMALLGACASLPDSARNGVVHVIRIDREVEPIEVYADAGDEIRWQNLRTTPVRVGLLGSGLFKHVTCAKGFGLCGMLHEHAVIQPNEAASLCFSATTTVKFNVWMDAQDLGGDLSPTGTIRVLKEAGSSS